MSKELRILNVDLTGSKTWVDVLDPSVAQRFIGGRGVGAYLLYNKVHAGIDPLSPENVLILSTGAAVNTGIPGSSRISYITKSAHRTFSFSHSGGTFPTWLKNSGYDHVVIQGKAKHPVYILIDGENVEIRDAGRLWGKLIWEADELIKMELGNDVLVGGIGPGGENLVPFASFVSEGHHVAAKGGAGFVAGSKYLKAIVVTRPKGKAKTDGDRIAQLATFIRQKIRSSATADLFKKSGSLNFVIDHYNIGAISGFNYTRNNVSDEGLRAYHPDLFESKMKARRESCYGCPVGCSQIFEINEEIPKTARYGKIEWGSLCALGSLLGIFDYEQLCYLVWLCAQCGIDAKEASSIIGMLMEMYESGVISEKDLDGLKMTWGNFEAAKEIIKATAYKTGLGAALGEGAEGVLRRFGDKTQRYYGWVKGCGVSGSDVRADYSWGLGHALSVRGPDCQHHFAMIARLGRKDMARQLFGEEKAGDRLSPEAKGRVVWWSENYKAILDSLGFCVFLSQMVMRVPPTFIEFFAYLYNAVLDEDISAKELLKNGERIVQIGRAFNSREGFSRADDTLPERFIGIPAPDAPIAGSVVPLSHPGMLDEYYAWRGCNNQGEVTLARLQEIGMEEIAGELRSVGKLSEGEQVISFSDNPAIRSLDKERTLDEFDMLTVHEAAPVQKDSSEFEYIDDRPQFT